MGCCSGKSETNNCCSAKDLQTENCMVCGGELIYNSQPETKECIYCEEEKSASVYCSTGHFVCDDCHGQEINDFIEESALNSKVKNPLQFAEKMMAHPNMPFLGSAHHLVVSAALLVALKNYGQFKVQGVEKQVTEKDIKEGIRRMKQIPSCSCADYGSCGAGTGVGAVFSILYEATCAKDRERTLAMRATNATLVAIANTGGPGCCKQSVRTALETGVELLKEQFGVQLSVSQIRGCTFSTRHPHGCKGKRCVYFN
ncbi:DUF5714 domain-containing protein [Halanaerobaculum tunisiense]